MRLRALAGLALFAGTALAQEPAPEAPPVIEVPEEVAGVPQEDAVALDDIIVTSTKRAAVARELPGSIVGLDGAALEALGVTELRDVVRRIPGLQMTELQPDLFRVSIRGIQADVSAVTPQTEGVFIDDVPVNDPFLMLVRPDIPVFDLDRIEIMKGPQGTLFGGSGLSGAIRYQLMDAEPGAWQARSFAHYSEPRDGAPSRVGGAALNVPLGERAALRLVGVERRVGGTIDDTRNGLTDTDRLDTSNQRALLRWNSGERLSIGGKFLRQEGDAADLPWADTTDGRLERSRRLQASPSRTRFDIGSVDATYGFDDVALTWVTGWMDKASSLLNAYGEQAMGTEDTGQPVTYPTADQTRGLTQEIRLASTGAGALQWLAGGYGQRYHSRGSQRVYVDNGLPLASILNFDSDVTARELAVFGEASLMVGDALRLTAGARGYQVETDGVITSSGALILLTGNPENRNDAQERERGINPKLAVEWLATGELRVYASASRGFRFGGIQLVGPSPAAPDVPTTYESDSLWNYELGLRSDWFEQSLRIDGAVFRMDWDKPQVQMSTEGAVALNIIDNAERARSQGAELSLRYRTPFDGLELEGAFAYTDARITEAYEGQGATVPAHSRLPGHADRQAMLAVRYARSLGTTLADARVSYQHQGEGVSDILQSRAIYGYETVDLRVDLRAPGLPLRPRLSMGISNLLDERAVVSAFVNAEDNLFSVYNRPRTADVRLELAF